jgi:hypothetical protein
MQAECKIDGGGAVRYYGGMAQLMDIADLPEDLVAEAAQVPGLRLRLMSFLRAEVTQHRKRQSQHSTQARDIVREAREEVAAMETLSAADQAEARHEFAHFYEELITRLK